MATITVYRPDDEGTAAAAPVDLAVRGRTPERPTLTIIENGKPNARALLRFVAEQVGVRLPLARIDVFSKPTAAKPIDADEARMLAARSHLVISGLGD